MSREHRILVTGTLGAGKSAALTALLGAVPPQTPLDAGQVPAALDHGELVLDGGERLHLYGTPGQRRFEPTWRELADGAMGLVVLVDPARPDPLADLAIYLENFLDLIARSACVVGVGRRADGAGPGLDAFAEVAARFGVVCPIVAVDVRDRAQVAVLMDLLLVQLESRGG